MKSEHGLNGLRRLTQIKICEIREILLNPHHGLNGLRRLTQIKIREIREILLNLCLLF